MNEVAVMGGQQAIVSIDYAGTVAKATELGRFVEERKLFSVIQGKKFVNVEGWQFAGMLMGVIPITEEPKRIEGVNNEIKYGCNVKLIAVGSNQLVGHGYAICSNLESTKKSIQV